MKRLLPILFIALFSAFFTPVHAGVDRLQAADPILRFYPNPATTVVTFDFQKSYNKGYSIEVYSFLGKKMYEAANINARTTIDLSDYTRGVYMYRLRDRSGKIVEAGKFQVSK